MQKRHVLGTLAAGSGAGEVQTTHLIFPILFACTAADGEPEIECKLLKKLVGERGF